MTITVGGMLNSNNYTFMHAYIKIVYPFENSLDPDQLDSRLMKPSYQELQVVFIRMYLYE